MYIVDTFPGVLVKQRRIALIGTALLAAVVLTGSPAAVARAPIHIAGNWHGTWASTTYAPSAGTWSAHFIQSGSTISGTVTISSRCVAQGTVHGTLTGTSITFGEVHNGTRTITFTGTVSLDGTRMHGTYHTPPICHSDHGTWRGHHA